MILPAGKIEVFIQGKKITSKLSPALQRAWTSVDVWERWKEKFEWLDATVEDVDVYSFGKVITMKTKHEQVACEVCESETAGTRIKIYRV